MTDGQFAEPFGAHAREREEARRRGAPWCEPLDLGVAMEPGAPEPRVHASSAGATVLEFRVLGAAPWSGEAEVAASEYREGEVFARLGFHGAIATLLGPPNDEAIEGHPLWGSGLEMYQAHVVHGSAWIKEYERRNRVHPNHLPERWHELTHYVITFHDETFECLARSVDVETRMMGVDAERFDLPRIESSD